MNVRTFALLAAQAADVTPLSISSGRLGAIAAVLTGLSGVVIGALSLRAGRKTAGSGRRGAAFALAAGVIGVGLGTLVVATAGGGLGTGHGLGGGVVALVVGTASLIVGGLAGAR